MPAHQVEEQQESCFILAAVHVVFQACDRAERAAWETAG